MIQKAISSNDYDYITSLSMAKVFYKTGMQLIHNKKPIYIFSGATNIALAIELYLKSLIVMEGSIKPNNHKLNELYNKLSSNLKEKIELKYKELNGGNLNNGTYFIRGRKENSNNTNNNSSSYEKSTEIIKLLQNHKNMFITFRYMCEKGRDENWEHFICEYNNLEKFIKVLEEQAYYLLIKGHL